MSSREKRQRPINAPNNLVYNKKIYIYIYTHTEKFMHMYVSMYSTHALNYITDNFTVFRKNPSVGIVKKCARERALRRAWFFVAVTCDLCKVPLTRSRRHETHELVFTLCQESLWPSRAAARKLVLILARTRCYRDGAMYGLVQQHCNLISIP